MSGRHDPCIQPHNGVSIMTPYFRALSSIFISLAITSCSSAFLKKSIDGNQTAEMHGVSSVNFGAFWLTTTYSNVPTIEASGSAGFAGTYHLRQSHDFMNIYVESTCDDRFVSAFASELNSWMTSLHNHLGWRGQANFSVYIGTTEGVQSRNHLIWRNNAPKATFWLPRPPTCSWDDLGTWSIDRIATLVHETTHVIARGTFDIDFQSELFAHFSQICVDFEVDGTVDSWPTRLTLSDNEWTELSTGDREAWLSLVSRTQSLPPSAASAVLITANFRAFDHPEPPTDVVGEFCTTYRHGPPLLQDRMMVPESRAR